MRTLTLMAAAGALALGSAGIALASQQNNPATPGKGGMARVDADSNGVITLEEVKAHSTARFEKLDANADGAISSADREAHAAQRFATADGNGDGELSPEEMAAAHEQREAKRAQRRAAHQSAMFERLDTDASGGLSPAELEAGKANHPKRSAERRAEGGPEGRGPGMGRRGGGSPDRGMKMLHAADTNGDEVVSREEFDAMAMARFARLDSDGSGTITPEERAAMRPMRPMHRSPQDEDGNTATGA